MNATVTRLWKGEEGQDLTEYALLIGLDCVGCDCLNADLGTTISNVFSNAAVYLTSS